MSFYGICYTTVASYVFISRFALVAMGTTKGRAECRVLHQDHTKMACCKLEASGQSLLSDSLYGAVWCSTVVYVILWHVLQFMVTL
jgi:hypothetical protein